MTIESESISLNCSGESNVKGLLQMEDDEVGERFRLSKPEEITHSQSLRSYCVLWCRPLLIACATDLQNPRERCWRLWEWVTSPNDFLNFHTQVARNFNVPIDSDVPKLTVPPRLEKCACRKSNPGHKHGRLV